MKEIIMITTLSLIILGAILKKRQRSPENLEKEYDEYNDGHDCSEKAFRAILAYLYWSDGAEWDFVKEVWYKDPKWTRRLCLETLAKTFSYGENNVAL